MKDPTSEREIRDRALNLLARREHTPAELQRKLVSRGFDPDATSRVLRDLESENFLSTERYVEARVRHSLNRGDGPRKIQARLQEAGVDGLSNREIRDENGEEVDWLEQARGVCERRFGEEGPTTTTEWMRRARFLAARGFPEDVVRKLLGRIPRG